MHSEALSSHRGFVSDHLMSPGGMISIAIKTLKSNATMKTQQDFRREMELMSELRHPNIVCLLGIVTRDQPQCMLFEYMAQVRSVELLSSTPFDFQMVFLYKFLQGDLHEFLVAHSPAACDGSVSGVGVPSEDGVSTLEQSDFLYIATQISAGRIGFHFLTFF